MRETARVVVIGGGAVGPWVTGLMYDHYGNYVGAFWVALVVSLVTIMAIWFAAPRKVRVVAGRVAQA